MNLINLLGVVVGIGAAVGAFLLYRRDQGGAQVADPVPSGIWGQLNEGLNSSPFLPQPDPVPAAPGGSPYVDQVSANAPRGIRNRNPGNVKRSGSAWLGKVPHAQSTDATFEQFSDPKYGIRVIAYLLLVYQRDKGKRTIRQLISEPGGWAPSGTDNNPVSYSTWVASQLGMSETAYLDLFARDDLLADMVEAIIRFENGQQPYPASLIADGVRLARESVR